MDSSAGSGKRIVSPAAQLPPASGTRQTLVAGQVIGIDASYTRELSVPGYLVVTMLAMGGFTRSVAQLIAAVLRRDGGAGGARPHWKDLRKGPEYLVTPLKVRDNRGRLVELEIHGYLAANALHRRDQIRARVRPQSDPLLPPRIHHLANLTTGQIMEPQAPTVWSHLGPALLLQAGLGVFLTLVVVGCLWGALR